MDLTGSIPENSSLDWREVRPEDGSCADCGAELEPTKHLSKELWLSPGKRCDECASAHRRKEQERQERAESFEKRWIAAGAPKRARKTAEAGVDLRPELAELVQLDPLDHDSGWWGVYLHGEVGTGKSTQGAAAIRAFLRRWTLEDWIWSLTARFCNVPKLLTRIRDSFGDDDAAPVTLQEFETAGLLVLDDLGRENATPWAAEQIYLLVEARCNEMRPTVFTSNHELKWLNTGDPHDDESTGHGNYDDRITSRIFEMCGGTAGHFRSIELTTNYRLPQNRRGEK